MSFLKDMIARGFKTNPVSNPASTKTERIEAGVAALGIAAAVVNPVAALGVVTKVAKSFIPKSVLGKVAALVAAPVVISAVSSSKKLQSEIVNAPSSLAGYGSDIGKFVEDPSLKTASNILTEHPVLSAATVVAGVAAVGAGAAGVAASIANTRAIKKNTEVTQASGSPAAAGIPQGAIQERPTVNPDELTSSAPVMTSPENEVLPGAEVSTTTKKRKKRSKSKTKPQNVNVRVNNYMESGPGNLIVRR